MHEITTDNLPWSSNDEFNWNSFLQTETGKRLIPKLAEQLPALLDGGDVNRILIRTGETRGFQKAVAVLLELTHSPPQPAQTESSYPDLDDNEKWPEQPNQ